MEEAETIQKRLGQQPVVETEEMIARKKNARRKCASGSKVITTPTRWTSSD